MPKKETLETIISDDDTDVVVITESWLNSDIEDHELLNNTSYTVYRRDRTGRRGGGVLVFVKQWLVSSRLSIESNHEILCLKIVLPTSTTILISCYRAPDCDTSFTNELNSIVSHLTTRFPRANLVLCGDFNFPDIDWENCTATSRASKDFLEIVLMYSLSQVVTRPTRSTNILDLVLSTKKELINSLQYVKGVSDHNILFFNIAIELPARQPSTKYIRDYNKANFPEINNQLESFFVDFHQLASSRTVEQNWLLYKHKLLSLIDAYVPLVRIRGDASRPWYSNSLRKLSRKKKAHFPRTQTT